jgi:competence protein ComEA
MNIKDKLLKIIKNKFFIIVCIIVILVASYIIIEEMMVDNNNEIEIIEEADDIFKKDEEENFEEKNILKDEVIDDIEEKIEEGTENIEDFENEVIKDNEKIYVYITGEVNNPGIVVLPIGSRIVDAIDCAGGITQKADIMKVNLVYMLQDGMKVNIPSSIELKNNPNFEYITMSSGDEKNDSNIKNATTVDTKSESAFKVSNVNINTATQTELETLPGIGPSLALKIINYRKENGKFKSIEELKSVNGIGENKYEEIKKYIYV